MRFVGLTGGIGSGKSTVTEMLRAHGAVILDADAFAREAVEPGTDALGRIVERFGREVIAEDGSLDRAALASIVFADPAALGDLEAIVHPEVRRLITEGIRDNLDTDNVVVLVNPLLIEMGTHRDCDVVVVLSVSPETQVTRAMGRGMSEEDVRARLAAQLPLDERAAQADVLLDNEGTVEELRVQVDALWERLVA
ncbi:MAG TPA: dephospho-CoA kinase [Actinomycetota bacterium]|nr:dephospho-CoA kinase [Actinomycetota bacterium]